MTETQVKEPPIDMLGMKVETGTERMVPATKLDTQSMQMTDMGAGVALIPKTMREAIEFAQLMARSGPCIPPAFRDNPGMCLAVVMRASRWGMDPFAVCDKAYVTKNTKGGGNIERLAFEAQLIAAVVNTLAPVRVPPNVEFFERGGAMYAIASAVMIRGGVHRQIETPPIKDINPKNSPLWTSDPQQQLAYYALRSWARRWVPQVLMGVYDIEEIENFRSQNAIDITPAKDAPARPNRADYKPASNLEVEKKPEPETSAEGRPPAPSGDATGATAHTDAPQEQQDPTVAARDPSGAATERDKTSGEFDEETTDDPELAFVIGMEAALTACMTPIELEALLARQAMNLTALRDRNPDLAQQLDDQVDLLKTSFAKESTP